MKRPKLRDEVAHPLQIIGLALLAAVVLVATVITVKNATPPVVVPAPTPSISASPSGPLALFIGDGDAAGIGLPTGKSGGFACRAAVILGWQCALDAQAGTGYVATGADVDPKLGAYASRLAADVAAYHPGFVVITGGRSDAAGATTPAARAYLLQEATAYVDLVAQAFPNAKLVVVGPFWPNAQPPQALSALRNTLQAEVNALGGTYIDTHGPDWTVPATDLAGNGFDLNANGQTYLAQRVAALLTGLSPGASSGASPS